MKYCSSATRETLRLYSLQVETGSECEFAWETEELLSSPKAGALRINITYYYYYYYYPYFILENSRRKLTFFVES